MILTAEIVTHANSSLVTLTSIDAHGTIVTFELTSLGIEKQTKAYRVQISGISERQVPSSKTMTYSTIIITAI